MVEFQKNEKSEDRPECVLERRLFHEPSAQRGVTRNLNDDEHYPYAVIRPSSV